MALMQIKQRFVVRHPRAAVWEFFGRLEEVTTCMPGASLAQTPDDHCAKFNLRVKLGPIAAAFSGDAEVERNDAEFKGVMRGMARDTRGDSRVKGEVNYALNDEDAGASTAVEIAVDFALTGRLAQFSRAGIVNDIAERLTAEFAQNLELALSADPRAAAGAVNGSPADTVDSTIQPVTLAQQGLASPTGSHIELKAGRLLVSVLLARVKRLFGWLFARG